ncbi:MAG: AAA family ATPase, partial [Actinomycetota bacterium]
MIERPRLHRRLAGRFEADVTTIVAAAGSGKSSLVHAVVEDNLLDPHGRDVVVQLRTRDADRTAFLARVATALGVSAAAASSADRQLEAIHDTIWSAAPDDVVVWIDDAHLLDDDAVAALELLTRELPANAHVGIVSRHPIEVGLARLRAQGRVIELAQTDLDLDDDEIERLTASIDPDGAHHDGRPRHAATAALIAATGGATASVAFLQEEVIDALQPARLAKLRRLVAADRIDEQLARTLTDDDELDLADLVGGLPLVAHTPDGAARLHDLLRDALVAGMPVAELR